MKRKKLIPDVVEEISEITIVKERMAPVIETIEVEEERSIRLIVEPSRRKSVKKAKVFIEGKLNIYNSEYLVTGLKEILGGFEMVDFRLRDVQEIDLSAIQIFYYFDRFYTQEGKKITFQMEDISAELRTLLIKTKYGKILFKKPKNTGA